MQRIMRFSGSLIISLFLLLSAARGSYDGIVIKIAAKGVQEEYTSPPTQGLFKIEEITADGRIHVETAYLLDNYACCNNARINSVGYTPFETIRTDSVSGSRPTQSAGSGKNIQRKGQQRTASGRDVPEAGQDLTSGCNCIYQPADKKSAGWVECLSACPFSSAWYF